jgi:hypothetical protein
MAPERQLRIVQVGCALVLLECFRVARTIRVTQTSTLVQWIVIALALWCASNGFLVQRLIVRGSKGRRRRSATSTPFTRWRAGNFARLAFGTSVGLYGLILRVVWRSALAGELPSCARIYSLVDLETGAEPESAGS